jgi:hypothetical protein
MKARHEEAKAAGEGWADELRSAFPFARGPLPVAFDALAHLSRVGDTGDPRQRSDEIRIANASAQRRWDETASSA